MLQHKIRNPHIAALVLVAVSTGAEMAYFDWMSQENNLSAAALTVRAQTISPNDQGRLTYDAFFPRQNVDSVKLSTITTIDFRPVSDRREWDARGRAIPLRTPDLGTLEMVPVEAYFKIAEREIQELEEQTLGNEAVFRDLIRARVPARTDDLVTANYRRIDVDAYNAWALGQISARNPQLGTTQTVSFGFAAARYVTAGTAWNAVANAYTALMDSINAAIDLIGPVEGVMLRLATLKEVIADAPNILTNITGIPPTRRQVEDRIEQELGTPFRFIVNETTHDIFSGAGQTVVRTKVWPAFRVAMIPAGGVVGNTMQAPVARAMQIARTAPNAGIDIRGQTVFPEIEGNGRGLNVEAQINAMPLPIESRIYVVNAGV